MALGEKLPVSRSSTQLSHSASVGRGRSSGAPLSVFVSYSHKDKPLVERLLAHLRVLQACGTARIFCDLEIRGGDRWRSEIEKEIDGATLVLCLLSADYLSSPFVNSHEVPRIRERQAAGARVVPVLLRSCAWQVCDWLEEHQVYMQDDGRALDLGAPEEVEQHFADLTLAVFNLLSEEPDFDPPAAALPEASVGTAVELNGDAAEDAKILNAGDRFRRKALAELQVRLALERLVAERGREMSPGTLFVNEPFQKHVLGRILVVVDNSASMLRSYQDLVRHGSLQVRENHVRRIRIYIRVGQPAFIWTAVDLRAGIMRHLEPYWDRDTGAIFSQGGEGPWTVYTSDAETRSGWGDLDALASPRWEDREERAICAELVIELRSRVPDHAAVAFSSVFYERLAAGDRLDAFLDDGCASSSCNWMPIQSIDSADTRPNGFGRGDDLAHLIYTSGAREGLGRGNGFAQITAGAATSSDPVIKIVLPKDSLSEFDRGTVLRLELDCDWSSSVPASSPRASSPYPWASFVLQGEWRCSPGIDCDINNNNGVDGIFLPNLISGRGGEERRGLYPAAAWGDIGFLNTGHGEAPYVC